MQRFTRTIMILSLTLGLGACSSNQSTPDITQQPPSFLPNYSLLKPIPSPKGTQIYSYKAPGVSRGDYHAALVEPVKLYQSGSQKNVSNAQVQQARTSINNGLRQIVSQKMPLTNQAGPGVFRLDVAITGASLETDGFKPWNIIPISAAIKLATMATGNESKKPMLVVELKFTDSQTGKLLKEVVTTISGDEFRDASDTADAFAKLANTWVEQAMKYAS